MAALSLSSARPASESERPAGPHRAQLETPGRTGSSSWSLSCRRCFARAGPARGWLLCPVARESQGREFCAVFYSELRIDVLKMALYCSWRHEKTLGGFSISETLADKCDNTFLSLCQAHPSICGTVRGPFPRNDMSIASSSVIWICDG